MKALRWTIGVCVAWLAISTTIFRFRHPWATETELFLHIPEALMLKKITYNEMRPR